MTLKQQTSRFLAWYFDYTPNDVLIGIKNTVRAVVPLWILIIGIISGIREIWEFFG